MENTEETGRVAVLLATQNGALYLEDQLESLARQTHPAIDVHVSDDDSTDGTMAILRDWEARWSKGRFVISQGPGRGFAENFRALIVNRDIRASYYAFCDQDDVWEPDKLERAIAWIGEPMDAPRLFCSRTKLVSEVGRETGHSVLFSRQPSFRNALVQSIAGGNTMVFNRAAHRLLFDCLVPRGLRQSRLVGLSDRDRRGRRGSLHAGTARPLSAASPQHGRRKHHGRGPSLAA